jgi:hypothetical protein
VASDQPPFRFWLGWPRRNRWWPRAESPFADFASRFALSEIWWPPINHLFDFGSRFALSEIWWHPINHLFDFASRFALSEIWRHPINHLFDFASRFALSEIWWHPINHLFDFASRFALSEIGWPRAESNHRHTDFQSAALPTELLGHYLKRGITILIQKQVKPTAHT